MADERSRGSVLTFMAVLFGLLAVSNATKPLQHLQDPAKLGIVIFGVRYETMAANAILGPLMALVLGAYAYGLWTRRPWVAPLSIAYAFYVPTNLIIFWYRQTGPAGLSLGGLVIYLVFALGGSIGTALYLAYHRDRLA